MEEITNSVPYGPLELAEMQFKNTNKAIQNRNNTYTWISVGIAVLGIASIVLVSNLITNYNKKILLQNTLLND